jgi:hypothetical protein
MKASRRLPAHSSKVALRAMVNAAMPPLECPAYVRLREQDRPFWDAILGARARDEWTESDLAVGAQLARCRADIEDESLRLENESTVCENKRGTLVTNPRVMVIAELTRRELLLMRALRMEGKPALVRDLNAQRGMERAASKARRELDVEGSDESLLV